MFANSVSLVITCFGQATICFGKLKASTTAESVVNISISRCLTKQKPNSLDIGAYNSVFYITGDKDLPRYNLNCLEGHKNPSS